MPGQRLLRRAHASDSRALFEAGDELSFHGRAHRRHHDGRRKCAHAAGRGRAEAAGAGCIFVRRGAEALSEYQLLLFDFTSCAREVGVARVVESAASRTGRGNFRQECNASRGRQGHGSGSGACLKNRQR